MATTNKNIQIIPSKKKGENKVSVVLENELTIFSIEKMREKIIESVLKYDEIDFQLKNVNNMDLTFIQLFYSIKVTSEKLNKKVVFNIDLANDVKSLFINSDLYKVLK
jgi:hypothetical protein